MSISDTTIAAIEQALRVDGVYVDPSLAGRLPEPVQQQLRDAVAASSTPVYVVAVPVSLDDPIYQGRTELLVGALNSDTGLDGVYIGVDATTTPARVETVSVGAPDATAADLGANAQAAAEFPDDLGQLVLTTIELVNNGQGDAVYEKYKDRDTGSGTTQPSSTPGSSDDGEAIGAGAVIGVVVALLVVAVGVGLAARWRARHASRPVAARHLTDRPFELPRSVLSTIRATQDRQLERRAESEVLALGEAIDTDDLVSSGRTDSWQAALDHYDLGRRILDREHTAADVVGAIVLAQRGREALADAVAGRTFTPTPPCYLNPLHGPGTEPTPWTGPRGEVTVPMCADCAAVVRRGNEPRDVLDFMVEGTPRHYFEIEAEPWTSTGYGALDPDLLTRLFTDPR